MKTTKAEFKRYIESFKSWQNLLNLRDFEVVFEHKKLTDAYACLNTNLDGRLAVTTLSSDIPQASLNGWNSPEHCALHEVLHLFLLKLLGESFPAENLDSEKTEGAVRVLEKLL
ncbi:MAG: hypothetical protein Q8L68_04880 [Methylococcales bacterium]|nr:hypothetical protein [Methylococcales bacterium]